jgi:SNF2 family DNA or RNA helicase
VLDGGQRLGSGITKFRQDYFHQVPWDQWTWYPNKDTPRLLTKKLHDLAHYIDEKDWNKMPELINAPITVKLDKKAYQQYKLLENEFIVKLESGEVVAGNSAILSGKLRQCASGSVYDADRNVHTIHEAKLDALESLVEELAGDPIMVAVGFLHEVDAIRKRLGFKIPYLGGGVKGTDVTKIIKNWNLGWIPILLVHPTSVAFGLNLQGGGNNICSYTLTWSAEEYDQLIRRLYRTGQKKRVMNYSILADKTIDLYVHEVLTNKDKVQTNFVQGLKRFFKVK